MVLAGGARTALSAWRLFAEEMKKKIEELLAIAPLFYGFSDSTIIPQLITLDVITAAVAAVVAATAPVVELRRNNRRHAAI